MTLNSHCVNVLNKKKIQMNKTKVSSMNLKMSSRNRLVSLYTQSKFSSVVIKGNRRVIL